MKMKKMLAALLAVCMLLTMLPVAAFAASDADYVIVVDDTGVTVNGVYLGTEIAPGTQGYQEDWNYYDDGTDVWHMPLVKGSFDVTVLSGADVDYVYVIDDAVLVDGQIYVPVMNDNGEIAGGTFYSNVGNDGTISGGTFEGDVYNYKTINEGIFSGYVNNLGEIAGGTFNGDVVNDGTINNGIFEGYVRNYYGTINGGTFCGTEVENDGIIEGGTFNSYVDNSGEIAGGTFNYYVDNYGTISGGTYPHRDAITNNNDESAIDYDNLTFIYEIFENGSEDYYPAEANGDDCYIEVKWDDDNNQKNVRPEKNAWKLNVIYRHNSMGYNDWFEPSEDGEETLDENTWLWLAEGYSPRALIPEDNADFAFNFEVPAGYAATVDGNTITMKLKEEPKPVVKEEPVEEETYDIVVRVKFDGVDEDEIDFVNAQLLKNGKAYKKAVKVDAKDEWRHEWTDLDDSSKIEWSVTADEIEGYDMEIVNVRANYWTITLSAKDAAVEKANPETGAADFVGAAVAMAVCSAACGAALSLKK